MLSLKRVRGGTDGRTDGQTDGHGGLISSIDFRWRANKQDECHPIRDFDAV